MYEGLLDEESFKMTTCLPVLDDLGEDTLEIYECSCLHVNFKGGFSKVSEAHRIIQEYADKQGIVLSDRAYEVYNKDMSVDVYYPQGT
jgi:effector-binding domain-containing protein